MSITFTDFKALLPHVWCAQTSAAPKLWTPDNPALGQCAVTAALAERIYGGEILWCAPKLPDGNKDSHYFNLINGTVYDFTRQQYTDERIIFPQPERKTQGLGTTYNYVASFPQTLSRLSLLAERFNALSGKRELTPWLMVDTPHISTDISSMMRRAKSDGYKLGLIAQGDESASRSDLAKKPIMREVDAVLITPDFTSAQLQAFMTAHGVDDKKSAMLIGSRSPAMQQFRAKVS